MQMTRREYLGIYLMKPCTAADRKSNAMKLKQAEAIRAEREISLINEQYGFLDKTKARMSVLDYFYSLLPNKDKKWRIVYEHFNIFVKGKCTFAEVNVDLCNKFREHLSTTNRIKSDKLKLSQNSEAGYWSTFRAFLAIAFKEGYLKENVNDYLDKLETKETRREFLTLDELNLLAKPECDYPVLKAASLFSCLTGLRLSDILQLEWKHIEDYSSGGKCVRIKTEKTDTEATIPISDQALSLCGEPSDGLIFKGLTRQLVNGRFKSWVKSAGIDKYITFHCFRHTYATLMIAGGADIYTVSKMLTHKNVSTTQIYADIVNEKKRQAAEIIKIEEKLYCSTRTEYKNRLIFAHDLFRGLSL
ncbi:MAG: site-specific integrase [Bacteroidales bacterium]|nr:site-specific integrase [Bacteroidales bacterium]